MIVLFLLLGSWLVFRAVGAVGVPLFATWQDAARYALAVMFFFTTISHFTRMKHDLARMVPKAFPYPLVVIYFTGVLEFFGAVGLLAARFAALAGICLILLLVAMFPANIRAARECLTLGGRPATRLWLRVPMQILLIGLLRWSTR
jgi:uncharacterized membrane protein